ncbi:NAD(P)H-dependent oxidoreductase [bacterium]|nr:NAD(P)H-dependent oxidoreductase [bacterium]
MKLLAFCGSLRSASLNRKVLNLAVQTAHSRGAEVTQIDLREYPMPPYDGDIEEQQGLPDGVRALVELIHASDGLLIASPEYNNSVSGVTKNVIDWVSRARPVPFKDKSALLMSASDGLVGGSRGLWALRVPLELLGTHVYPGMFSLASASKAFDENDALLEASQQQRLEKLVGDFTARLQRFLS